MNHQEILRDSRDFRNHRFLKLLQVHGSGVLFLAILAITACFRLMFLDFPPERDEGRYAFFGQTAEAILLALIFFSIAMAGPVFLRDSIVYFKKSCEWVGRTVSLNDRVVFCWAPAVVISNRRYPSMKIGRKKPKQKED